MKRITNLGKERTVNEQNKEAQTNQAGSNRPQTQEPQEDQNAGASTQGQNSPDKRSDSKSVEENPASQFTGQSQRTDAVDQNPEGALKGGNVQGGGRQDARQDQGAIPLGDLSKVGGDQTNNAGK